MKKQIIKQKLNELADNLFNDIASVLNGSSASFFDGVTVVVPNKKMESWLKAYWLNSQDKVLMNVDFINLDKFLLSIFDVDPGVSLAATDDYKNNLIELLSAKSYDETIDDIKDYLFDDVDGNKVINPTKLYELASTLTTLFKNYEAEGVAITGWQKDYYDSLINEFEPELTTLNSLLSKGTDIKKNDKTIFVFGFLDFDFLYNKILDEYSKASDIYVYELELITKPTEKKYEISSSPSITKEIEVVHSKICELLKDKDNGIKPTDFLVIGNNISEYENIIKKVFIQDENDNFASIPFSISGSKKEDSNLTNALNILLNISNKGFFTRLDFYLLINNPLVQFVRGIDDDQVEQWMNCIYNLNIYRGKMATDDDWDYIRKRLLLSKISNVNFDDNIVIVENEDYIPYSVIGLDDGSIVSFVSVLDDIKSWIEMMNKLTLTSEDALNTMKAELAKWFRSKNDKEIDRRYLKAVKLIDYYIAKQIVAPINTFLFALLDVTRIKTISFREPFVTGVTFMEFNENITYHQKYIFFINAGSSSLPKKKIKSEIDLRANIDNSKEKNAFLYLYQNADYFYISFIGMDLKKDAELFESTFSKELRMLLNPQKPGVSDADYEDALYKEIVKHTIDETREWDKLYTRGEYNRKDYREGLSSLSPKQGPVPSPILDPDGEIQERRKKISTSDIAKYLEEPLSFKAKYLFGQEDDEDELNHEEYEPFTLDTLEEYVLVSKICEIQANYIKNGQSNDFDYEEYKKQLKLENKLPRLSDEFAELSFENAEAKADGVMEEVGIKDNPSEFEIVQLPDLLMDNNGEEWILVCKKRFLKRKDNNELHYYELKINAVGIRKSLSLYACALMDVALLNDNVDYTIVIHQGDAGAFSINSDRAKELLNLIFNAINDYMDISNYFAYLDFEDKDVNKFTKLMTFIGDPDNGKWNYFPYTKLFNLEDEAGYDKDNYTIQDYFDKVNKIIELIECTSIKSPKALTTTTDGGNNNGSI